MTNRSDDVFVKTLATGAIQRVSTGKDGGQAEEFEPVSASDWSPDGTQIILVAGASNLVPGDTNNAYDVFV